ncbi:glycosyltransferase family 2 protein [Nocardioides anomalus]|uniref:Glycosyltransferase family 2 protein n=1 Tax=Nocardioides anomalus TaxID=2712223 RepID=A0A6G6WEJ7_9ACTN|nr:glycosyltransferase family 2 protein [Nocardioides anomalus]QIG43654.1 glycosyltransferase family 2 protein [Nocardioides anomalus]
MAEHLPRTVAYVLPVFDEADGIDAFHRDLVDATSCRPDLAFEFVYIDDGSRDASLERLLALRAHDDRVTVVSLSRNHGHQVAVTAGIDLCAHADAVVVMDTDGQDPPAVSLRLLALWEHGVDVVYAQRLSRQDGVFKRATASAFYWTLDKVSDVPIPRDVGDFRLMDRRVVAELARYREHDRFLRGIVAHIGFRQEAVLYDRAARTTGTSGYPLRAMARLAASGLLGFSTTPLRLISRAGLLVSLISVGLAAYVFGVRVLDPDQAVPGWAFLGVGMFLLSGLQLVMMGVIGSYLGRVYVEAQDRPLYVVSLVARGGRVVTDRRST